ncbi:MAG: nucleoside-diphosphate kinase [Nitrososphaerota archaeon]
MTERTLIVIKPDGVRRGLVGKILSRFEDRGFKIVGLKMQTLTKEEAEEFYSPHVNKPFFSDLISFITSGPIVAAIIEGPSAIEVVRRMIGPTNPKEAPSGTIRGDFGLGLTENVVHASDSFESYLKEASIIFEDLFNDK